MSERLPLPVAALLLLALSGCHVHPDRGEVRRRTESLYGPGFAAAEPGGEPAPAVPVPAAGQLLARADLGLYLRYGLHHNGALRAAYERWRAALERIPQVTTLPDPEFGFAHFVEAIETRTGPQERRYSLSQTLPWFGKLSLRGAVAGGHAEELWHEVASARLGVEREIRVAWYDYAYLGQTIRIAREVLELLRQLEPVVQQRIAGGAAGQRDLLRLQVEIGRVENDLAGREQVRGATSARLAAALNLPDRRVLPLPELAEPEHRPVPAEELVARAGRTNPELRRLAESLHTGRSELELAGLERWPDLTVGVDWFETGAAALPVAGSGEDPWALRLMFRLPIGRARYAAAEREAERRLAAAGHELADRRASLRAEVEQAVFALDDAARQVELYRQTLLPRARESLTVTRAAYRGGNAPLLDLIDSERALLDFETGYWRACRDHHQSRARLEALIGGAL